MTEYQFTLIVPHKEQVFIYRKDGSIEIIKGLGSVLRGENVMPDFEFDLGQYQLS